MRPLRKMLLAAVLASPMATQGCDYPDEGTMPLHRAITRVKLLPQTRVWAAAKLKDKVVVQYALLLDRPVRRRGVCYWTVEARAEGAVWQRFHVSPDGKRVFVDQPNAAAR